MIVYGRNYHHLAQAEQPKPARTCRKCKRELPAEQFAIHEQLSGIRRYSDTCKECEEAIRQKLTRPVEITESERTCAKCGRTKPIEEFVSKQGNLVTRCNKCAESERRSKAKYKARQEERRASNEK